MVKHEKRDFCFFDVSCVHQCIIHATTKTHNNFGILRPTPNILMQFSDQNHGANSVWISSIGLFDNDANMLSCLNNWSKGLLCLSLSVSYNAGSVDIFGDECLVCNHQPLLPPEYCQTHLTCNLSSLSSMQIEAKIAKTPKAIC